MEKNIIPQLILFFVFTLNTIKMNAQEDTISCQELNLQQKSLVAISALTSVGNLENLKKELHNALDTGVSINEIKEVIVQLYAYCGFPKSLNAIGTFKNILEERIAKGIKDNQGKEIIVENNNPDKYEQGRKVLEILTKIPQIKPAPGFGEFAPRIDAFLKEHLFADVFNSDVLTYQQRELVTISSLAAMTGTESQLDFHLTVAMNTGLTLKQLEQVSILIKKYINKTQSNIFDKVLQKK
jgi:4-carboxymuconolactone decarboxylase